jgi:hypothetical protein
VEGVGAVAPYLDIDAKGTAVKIQEATLPTIYSAPGDNPIPNGGLAVGGGFSDLTSRDAKQAHRYVFTFAGISVSDFSLHMLDFGDYNPSASALHSVSLTAYDENGMLIAQQGLSYTTPEEKTPRDSDLYGDMWFSGDAVTASSGQPGNWTWSVSGDGITQVILDFGVGFDPFTGFDTLSYVTECQ